LAFLLPKICQIVIKPISGIFEAVDVFDWVMLYAFESC
jgi:hypothetical protein